MDDHLTACGASIQYEGEPYDGLPPHVCILPAGHKESAHSNGLNVTWTALDEQHLAQWADLQ